MSSSNSIQNIAIVGAGGNIGRVLTKYLLQTGRHTLTAITRVGSESKTPEGIVSVKAVNYDQPSTVVEALRGQNALIICLAGFTPAGVEMSIVKAAAEADVSWILPSEWGIDTDNELLIEGISGLKKQGNIRKAITDLGKSSFVAVNTGFWLEWSLAIPGAFGFDFANRTATFYDDGTTKICVSTWPQVGRAVAAILSLPVKAEGSAPSLDQVRNKVVYINSFTISQRDMFESALRVTSTKVEDWTVIEGPVQARYMSGVEELKQGNSMGFLKFLYARPFFPDGTGNFEHKGLLNDSLALPEENLDEAVGAGIERSKWFKLGH